MVGRGRGGRRGLLEGPRGGAAWDAPRGGGDIHPNAAVANVLSHTGPAQGRGLGRARGGDGRGDGGGDSKRDGGGHGNVLPHAGDAPEGTGEEEGPPED